MLNSHNSCVLVFSRRLVTDAHTTFHAVRVAGDYMRFLTFRRYMRYAATCRKQKVVCYLRNCRRLASRKVGLSRWGIKALVWRAALPGVYKTTF